MDELPMSQETLVYALLLEVPVAYAIDYFFRLRGLGLDKNTAFQYGSFFSREYDGFGEPFIPGTLMFRRFFSRPLP
jgi:hypothetical protein